MGFTREYVRTVQGIVPIVLSMIPGWYGASDWCINTFKVYLKYTVVGEDDDSSDDDDEIVEGLDELALDEETGQNSPESLNWRFWHR